MAVDDTYTKSLLHFNGTDASTTFTDESGKSWTPAGNAQIDTSQFVFGGASGLFDGTGDYISTPDSADFALGTGDFTIDCRVRWATLPTAGQAMFIWAQGTSSTNIIRGYLYHRSSPDRYELYLDAWSDGSTFCSFSYIWTTPAINTWYHLAWIRNGNNWYTSIDGAQAGSTTNTFSMPDIAASFYIGFSDVSALSPVAHNGWIDEFRLSKGIARWTSFPFTPPTAEYGPAVSTGRISTLSLMGVG